MTTGLHPRHHRKQKHNLAPRERSNVEKAVQHSAAVRAKGKTKASTLRRDNMRFMAVRPDLFDTPIPGLGDSTDEHTLSASEGAPSPRTGERTSSSGPSLSRGLQPGEHRQVSMVSPSPSSTSRPSSDRHHSQRHHPGSLTGASSPMSLLSRPLSPSPAERHVSRWEGSTKDLRTSQEPVGGFSRGFSPFHDLPFGSGHRYASYFSIRGIVRGTDPTEQPSPRNGDAQRRSSLTEDRRHDDTTEPTTTHPSREREGPQTDVDRRYSPFVTLSDNPINQQTTPWWRSPSRWRSPSIDISHEMGTPVHAGQVARADGAELQQHLDMNSTHFGMPEDNADLVMEDGFPGPGNGGDAHGNDPYRRLSALEDRVDLQSQKLDATNTKLDLLCDLIQHLTGPESSYGGDSGTPSRISGRSPSVLAVNSSGPHASRNRAAPTLLVLGSRPDPQANRSPPQVQNNVITRRRARAELRIERAIDAHWKTLMSTYQLPERGVVKGYKLENGKACSENIFQPDHRETVRSPWNTSVVEVFVDSLLSSNHPHIPTPPTPEMRIAVFRLAFSQLRSWRAKQLLTADEEKAKLREKRRYERRRQSYFRRVNIASLHTDTRRHLQMLSYLGPNGMSSDESDHEKANGIAQYRIKPKDWRHPDLVRCVRVLDALHRKDRFQGDDDDNAAEPGAPIRLTAGPGAPTHLRVEGGSHSTRKPKKGLPGCFYNPDLLKMPEAERLQVIPSEPYDFGHTASVIEMARPKNGDASRLGPFPEM